MKQLLILITLLAAMNSHAESSGEQWQASTLTESTIKKIQEAKIDYRKCITGEMQKPAYLDQDTRKATDQIIKLCEPTLGKMRDTYVTEKVPAVIADRHLKQIRIQTTRNVLEELMFTQANRGNK